LKQVLTSLVFARIAISNPVLLLRRPTQCTIIMQQKHTSYFYRKSLKIS
jgi:hypothetical protein